MSRNIPRPSAAMAVALLALFVALSGTAVAAGVVPLAKRALVADNAKTLQGKTPADLLAHEKLPAKRALEANNALKVDGLTSAQIAALPSPSTSAAGMVAVKTAPWTVSPRQYLPLTVMCDAGQKAIGGGWADPQGWAEAYESYPTGADDGWTQWVYVGSNAPGAQSGTVYAICVK